MKEPLTDQLDELAARAVEAAMIIPTDEQYLLSVLKTLANQAATLAYERILRGKEYKTDA